MTPAGEVYPSIARRVSAGLIDLCLLAVALSIATWVGLALQGPAPETGQELLEGISRLWFGLFLPAAILLTLILMACFWATLKATPGQLLTGCQVTRSGSDRPLSLIAALWRGMLLLALGGFVAIPLIPALFDRRRRGLHDWLSFSILRMEDESHISLKQWKETIA